MNRVFLLILSIALLASCNSNPIMDKVSDVLPGEFGDDRPYIEQIGDKHDPSSVGIGIEQDRLRAQSHGRGLIYAPDIEKLMNTHLQRLKQASGVSGLNGHAYISAEKGFAARTSADGNIYIPIDMLNDLDNSHQLAALLAHELSHTILNHHDSDLLKKLNRKALLFTSLSANLNRQGSSSLSERDQRRIRNVVSMTLVSDAFISPVWERSQEEAADKLGTDLLVKAGYNLEAMNVVLQKLDAWEKRNEAIKSMLEKRRNKALSSLGNNQVEDENIGLKKLKDAVTEALARFRKSHPSPEKRLASLREYISKHYRRSTRPPMLRDQWSLAIQRPETQTLLRAVNAVGKAEEALAENEPKKATQLILRQVNKHTWYQTVLRQALAESRDAEGRPEAVLTNLRYAMKARYPSYRVLFDYYIRNSKGVLDKQLLSLLYELFVKYGKPSEYYAKLIVIADRVGDIGLKTKMQAECKIAYYGEKIACGPNETASSNEINIASFMRTLL